MKKNSKYALERVKSTLVGRLLCRLVGDQTGAVMMEYVVVGVLVVAAAVAMVLVFGKQIRNSLDEMTDATQGQHTTLNAKVTANRTATDNAQRSAAAEGDNVAGGEVVQ